MIRRGFINGLLTGGAIVAALAMILKPQRKPSSTKEFMARTRRMGHKASKVAAEVRHGVREIKDIID